MVRVEVGGRPIIDVSGFPIRSTRSRVRNSGNGRLHFNWSTVQPRVVITSDTDEFDEEILNNLQEEGFQIWYMPYSGDHAAYNNQLQHLADPLELGENYAIIGM